MDPAELWLAAIGIAPFMGNGPRIPLSASLDRAVQGVIPEIRKQLRIFLRKGGPAPAREDLDFRAVADAVFEPPNDAALAERITALPEDVQGPLVVAAARAVSFLRQRIPVTRKATALSLEYREPAAQDRARFARAYATVNDPLTAFRFLAAGRLSGEEKDALASVYPTLYETAVQEAWAAIADVYAGQEEPRMPRAKETQMQLFLGSSLSGDVMAAVQQAVAQLEEQPEPKRSSAAGKVPSLYESGSESVA